MAVHVTLLWETARANLAILGNSVNFSVAKVGMAKTASTDVGALMAAVVIMLLAHATVLQDGRVTSVQ